MTKKTCVASYSGLLCFLVELLSCPIITALLLTICLRILHINRIAFPSVLKVAESASIVLLIYFLTVQLFDIDLSSCSSKPWLNDCMVIQYLGVLGKARFIIAKSGKFAGTFLRWARRRNFVNAGSKLILNSTQVC